MRGRTRGHGWCSSANVSDSYQHFGPEKAHEWLPAGLTDDVLRRLIDLQLALVALLRVLGSVTLSLLLRFSSLKRG